jgi:hypothetical protein
MIRHMTADSSMTSTLTHALTYKVLFYSIPFISILFSSHPFYSIPFKSNTYFNGNSCYGYGSRAVVVRTSTNRVYKGPSVVDSSLNFNNKYRFALILLTSLSASVRCRYCESLTLMGARCNCPLMFLIKPVNLLLLVILGVWYCYSCNCVRLDQ